MEPSSSLPHPAPEADPSPSEGSSRTRAHKYPWSGRVSRGRGALLCLPRQSRRIRVRRVWVGSYDPCPSPRRRVDHPGSTRGEPRLTTTNRPLLHVHLPRPGRGWRTRTPGPSDALAVVYTGAYRGRRRRSKPRETPSRNPRPLRPFLNSKFEMYAASGTPFRRDATPTTRARQEMDRTTESQTSFVLVKPED